MILTVIGSGTAVPSLDRAAPCLHLKIGGEDVLFDAGSGSVRQLWKNGLDIRELRRIFLTHFHPDHTADLVPLLFALRNPEFAGSGSLLLGGPTGLKPFFGALEELYGDWIRPGGVNLAIEELAVGVKAFPGWTLRSARTGHTAESLAYRVDGEGKSFLYSGDTPFSEAVIALGAGVDVMVLECSFPEGPPRAGHLMPSQAGEMARRARADRLVLTHFYPAAAEADLRTPCAAHFDGEIVLARDGLALEI